MCFDSFIHRGGYCILPYFQEERNFGFTIKEACCQASCSLAASLLDCESKAPLCSRVACHAALHSEPKAATCNHSRQNPRRCKVLWRREPSTTGRLEPQCWMMRITGLILFATGKVQATNARSNGIACLESRQTLVVNLPEGCRRPSRRPRLKDSVRLWRHVCCVGVQGFALEQTLSRRKQYYILSMEAFMRKCCEADVCAPEKLPESGLEQDPWSYRALGLQWHQHFERPV